MKTLLVLLACFVGFWAWPIDSQAYITAYPIVTCNHTAASASQADVTEKKNLATSGQTVCVPAGTATWPAGLGFDNNRNITLAGCAAVTGCVGTTTITLTTSSSFYMINTSAPWLASRVTGFTLSFTGSGSFQITGAVGYRIDHNIISRTTWGGCFKPLGSAPNPSGVPSPISVTDSEGVIDHNTLTNCRLEVHGEPTGGGGSEGHTRWSEPLNMGTVHNNYMEDNVIGAPVPSLNFVDVNNGGRYAIRFNTVTNQYVEFHSVQGDGVRGARLLEVYYNRMLATGAMARSFLIRAGTGVVFHNNLEGTNWPGSPPHIDYDNVRSCDDFRSFPIWGHASAAESSYPDGNTGGQDGGPARDQVGTATDAFFWTEKGKNPAAPIPTQTLQPHVWWKNTAPTDGGELTAEINFCQDSQSPFTTHYDRVALQIAPNRNFYTYNSAGTTSPITTGVGEGTLANRPAVCTEGVFYWATDQGSWNTSTSNLHGVQVNGADGLLYRCGAANAWALFFTPFTYPHPLNVDNTPQPPPETPTGLRIVGGASATSVTLVWPASTDPDLAWYRVYRKLSGGVYSTAFAMITKASASAAHKPMNEVTDRVLVAGTYCWRFSEGNTAGNESDPSTESCRAMAGMSARTARTGGEPRIPAP